MDIHELRNRLHAKAAYYRECADAAAANAKESARRGDRASFTARIDGMASALQEAARDFETLAESS